MNNEKGWVLLNLEVGSFFNVLVLYILFLLL